jgi:hypothetical protein
MSDPTADEEIVARALADVTKRIFPQIRGYEVDWEAWLRHAREVIAALRAAGRLT